MPMQNRLRILSLAPVHLSPQLIEVGPLQDAGNGLAGAAEADGQGAAVQSFEEVGLLDFAALGCGHARTGAGAVPNERHLER